MNGERANKRRRISLDTEEASNVQLHTVQPDNSTFESLPAKASDPQDSGDDIEEDNEDSTLR